MDCLFWWSHIGGEYLGYPIDASEWAHVALNDRSFDFRHTALRINRIGFCSDWSACRLVPGKREQWNFRIHRQYHRKSCWDCYLHTALFSFPVSSGMVFDCWRDDGLHCLAVGSAPMGHYGSVPHLHGSSLDWRQGRGPGSLVALSETHAYRGEGLRKDRRIRPHNQRQLVPTYNRSFARLHDVACMDVSKDASAGERV